MTQQKLDTQRDVVKNERRWSVDNQPYGTWWERLPALCFPPEHPFHHSLIGSMERPRRGEPRRRRAVLRDVLHAGQRGALDRRRLRPRRGAATGRAALRPDPARRGQAAAAGHDAAADASASRCARSCRTTSCCRASSSRSGRRCSAATSTTPRACAARSSACAREAGCIAPRARAAGRRRGAGVHVRPAEGERPARGRRHGASGDDQPRSSSARCTRRSIDCCDDGVTAEEVERAVALIETEFDRRAAGGRRSRRQALDVRDILRRSVARERAGGALSRRDGGAASTRSRASASAPDNRASLLYVPRDTEATSANAGARRGRSAMTGTTTPPERGRRPAQPDRTAQLSLSAHSSGARSPNGMRLVVAPVAKLPLVTDHGGRRRRRVGGAGGPGRRGRADGAAAPGGRSRAGWRGAHRAIRANRHVGRTRTPTGMQRRCR